MSTSSENTHDILYIPSDIQGKSCLCSFKLTKKLGEGTFGVVRLATNIQTGEEVAIKIMEKARITNKEDQERIARERDVLQNLRHANIVHLYSVIETEQYLYLIMEYVQGKELFDYIIDHTRLTEIEACKYYQQIVSGMEYLHAHKIVHRDVKPENLLLDSKTKDLKIVDFGLSNIFADADNNNFLLRSACGSPSYAAPEMLDGKDYKAPPVDIWSSGIVLYGMVCGFLPFEDDSNDNEILYKKIISGKFSFPPWLSENCKDLIKKILTTDPTKRITIQGIKKHPWFNQINQSTNINKGLLLKEVIIPIDEGVISEMQVKYGFKNKKEIRECILRNRHNDITTIYYLIARKKVKTGYKSVVNLKSKLFLNYINDPENSFEKYHYDINEVIASRGDGVAKEKMKNRINSKSVEKHSQTATKLKPPLDNNERPSRFNSPQTKTIKRSYINSTKDDTKYNSNNSNKKNKTINYNNITTSKHNCINSNEVDDNVKHKLAQTSSKLHHGKSKSLNKKGVSINLAISSGKKAVRKHLKLFNNNKTPINNNYFNTGGNGNWNSKSLKKDLVKHYPNNINPNIYISSDIDDNEETIIEMKQKQFEDLHRKIKTTPNFSPLKVQNQSSYYHFKSISQLGNSNSVLNYNIKSIHIEEPVLVNLGCVSMKSKVTIKQNLMKVLNGMKMKFNAQSKTKFFVYGSSGDNLMVEINIVNLERNSDMKCNSIKFKKRLGSNEGFNKFTRKILSKLDL